jgi:predicted TIM-barrel enzyme
MVGLKSHSFRMNKRQQLTSILAVNRINPRVRELSRRWIQKIGVPVLFDVNAVTPVRADPEFRSRRAIDLL